MDITGLRSSRYDTGNASPGSKFVNLYPEEFDDQIDVRKAVPITWRPNTMTHTSTRPAFKREINFAVDIVLIIVLIISISFSIVGFFVFLLEMSAGRASVMLPSFSAFFIFLVVSLIVFRLRKSIKLLQREQLPL